MGTLYGDGFVYSYEAQGGISLMSNDLNNGGTVSGGSGGDEGGSSGVPTRISWTITWDGGSGYTGGITASGFYSEAIEINSMLGGTEYIYGPFFNYTPEYLYNHAIENGGNLNDIFEQWNTGKYSDSVSKFIAYLEEVAPLCVHRGSVVG